MEERTGGGGGRSYFFLLDSGEREREREVGGCSHSGQGAFR